MLALLLGIVAAQTPNTWVSGSDHKYFNQGNELAYNFNGITNKAGMTRDGFYVSTNGYVTDQYKPNTDKLFFLQFGNNALLEFRDDTKDFGEVFANVGYDASQGPFTAAIEYDRTFRVYNRMNNIIWEWPNYVNKKQSLEITENGGVKIYNNFLRRGEYLVSPNKNWFIYLNTFGALIDNNGNVLNKDTVSAIESPRILEMNRYGSLQILDKTGNVISTLLDVTPPNPPPVTISTTMFITDDGVLQESNGFVIRDLSASGKSIGENYFPIISVDLGTCLTRVGGKLLMQACKVGNYDQLFTYSSDYFRVLSDPSKCVTRTNNQLIVGNCNKAAQNIIFTNVMKDGTIRTKDNMCFDSTATEVKLSSCEFWETNKNTFTWTQNYVNPKNLEFMHIYNSDKSLLISEYANGWINGNLSETLPLKLMNENDNVKWAFDSANRLRFSPSPAYCMQVAYDYVIPAACNSTSTTWQYVNNKLYDSNKFNCLTQDGTNVKYKRCNGQQDSATTWYMLDTPSNNPGHNTTVGDYKLVDTYSMFSGALFGKFAIDDVGHLHQDDFCYSPDLKQIACNDPNLGKFVYENNQIKLVNSNLVINDKFQLENNMFTFTQYIKMGDYKVFQGVQNKIYNLKDANTCLGLDNGIVRSKNCNDAENFYIKDNKKIALSSNSDFCLDGDKATLCSNAKPFKVTGPTLVYDNDMCLSGTGLKQCNGVEFYSLNKNDVLPGNMLYDNIYNLGTEFCVGVDANNRAVPSTCEMKWTFNQGKIRSMQNPFMCLEKDSNNKITYAPCSTTVWKDNTLSDNSFTTDRMCLTSDTQYYVGRCSGLPTQRYSFNKNTPIREFTKLISYDNNKCAQANPDGTVIMQQCLDLDVQKWSYGSDGSILNVNGQCLGNNAKLEDCGITVWLYADKALQVNNKCLTDRMTMEACTQDISQKWFFGKNLNVPPGSFYTVYNLNSDKCLINCDAKVAIVNGQLIDGSNPNRCFDGKLQSILCDGANTTWALTDNFLKYDNACLSKDLVFGECNPNDVNLMWGTGKVPLSYTWESFTPPLMLNGSHLIAGQDKVQFAIDSNSFIRNSLNPVYCLDNTATFGSCDRAAKWNRDLVSGTLCFNGNSTAPCNGAPNQKWHLGTVVTPTKFEEITLISQKKCIGMFGDMLKLLDCNGGKEQLISVEGGRIRTQQDPTKCLNKDLKFTNECIANTWTYDVALGRIQYVPSGAVLDGGAGLYLYPTWLGNGWQVFGPRSRWPVDNYRNIKSLQWNLIFNNVDSIAIASKDTWSKFMYKDNKLLISDNGKTYCLTTDDNDYVILGSGSDCVTETNWEIKDNKLIAYDKCLETVGNKLGNKIRIANCNDSPAQYWKY